jgi:uncharacterized membrane protein YbhN (UPF0104 family)
VSKYGTYIRIGVTVVFLAIIGWRTNWEDVATKFANLNFGLWFAAVGILVAAQFASAKRWQVFARELQFQRSLSDYCAFYFIGMYFNLVLPTSVGGDVVRVWYLNANSGRRLAAFASVMLERINGLLVLFVVACVGALLSPVPLPEWVHYTVWSLAGCAAVGLALLPLVPRISWLPEQRREQAQTVVQMMFVPRILLRATVTSIVVQGFGVLAVWCLGLSLGLDVPIAYYCILGPMVSLLTLLPISVNGVGVREFGTYLFLAAVGVDESTSNTLAFLWFAAIVAVSLMGGAVYLSGAFGKAKPADDSKEGSQDGTVDRGADQGRERELNKAA